MRGYQTAASLCRVHLAQQYGFAIPDTVVTNDPTVAADFVDEKKGEVVFKGIGGTRTIVAKIGNDELDRLSLLPACPVMFQEFVPGVNVRVHVVGDRLFATRIFSDAVDYRYAPTRFEPVTLPTAVADACVSITHDLELLFSGIDLIENDHVFWFLEANPSPGFSFYELNTGLPISEALVELLVAGSGPTWRRERKSHCVDRGA